jgi:fluoride exporter
LVGALAWVGAALFGALGALARFRLDSTLSSRFAMDFPIGIFVVNITGAFALAVLVGASVSHRALFVLGTGFMGGYTPFSTWMVQSERLGEAGDVVLLLANLGVSLLVGFGAAAAGWYVGHALT